MSEETLRHVESIRRAGFSEIGALIMKNGLIIALFILVIDAPTFADEVKEEVCADDSTASGVCATKHFCSRVATLNQKSVGWVRVCEKWVSNGHYAIKGWRLGELPWRILILEEDNSFRYADYLTHDYESRLAKPPLRSNREWPFNREPLYWPNEWPVCYETGRRDACTTDEIDAIRDWVCAHYDVCHKDDIGTLVWRFLACDSEGLSSIIGAGAKEQKLIVTNWFIGAIMANDFGCCSASGPRYECTNPLGG